MRGRFITLEGVEGAGKSTQARLLAEAIQGGGQAVLRVREPGGTPVAEAVRSILLDPDHAGMAPEAELLLHCAARADHVRRVIEPALAAGTHVICDRFSDSTRAYQGAGQGVDSALVERVIAAACGPLEPDLTILLDLPAEDGVARVRRRAAESGQAPEGQGPGAPGAPRPDRYEGEALAFHRRVRSGFLRLAGLDPVRVIVVDASRSSEEVAVRIRMAVRHLLPGLLPA